MHYPVDRIITVSRQTFYEGKYNVEYVPLNAFPDSTTTWTNFMGGMFEISLVHAIRMSESRVFAWARRVGGDRVVLAEPEHPQLPDKDGVMVDRPHGSVLHFTERPPQFVNTDALKLYLSFRGVRLSGDHTRTQKTVVAHPESLDPDLLAITYTYRGVLELVQETLLSDRDSEVMTLDEFEQQGNADPIPWEYTSDEEWTLFKQDGSGDESPNFKKVVRACKVFNDDVITKWFGVNNANRCVIIHSVPTHNSQLTRTHFSFPYCSCSCVLKTFVSRSFLCVVLLG